MKIYTPQEKRDLIAAYHARIHRAEFLLHLIKGSPGCHVYFTVVSYFDAGDFKKTEIGDDVIPYSLEMELTMLLKDSIDWYNQKIETLKNM